MEKERLRAWYWQCQGLDRVAEGDAAAVHIASGWARSVGGCNPYLYVWSRARIGRQAFDDDMAAMEILELPSARGCTYSVPKAHFALALAAGRPFGESNDLRTAIKYLGVTEAEIDDLAGAVLQALEAGDLDPKELKEALGERVRNLGPEGKKRGVTTTLPLALGRLKTRGRILNRSVNGRIDTQRYRYALWRQSPADDGELESNKAFEELARLYFSWAGPASVAQFAWFSGLGKGAAAAAMQPLGLEPLADGSDLQILPEHRPALESCEPAPRPQFQLLSSLDNLTHLRRDMALFVDEADHARSVPGEKGLVGLNGLSELWCNPIYDRGRLVGVWEYEPASESIVWHAWAPRSDELDRAVAETEAFIRAELGDARSFSLDSPESRSGRIETIRSLQNR